MTAPNPHEGSVAMQVRPDQDGQMWIAIDSLVDLFADMAAHAGDGAVKNSMENLANTFRPVSSYAGMEKATAGDDPTAVVARRCADCGQPVVDARRIDGTPVIVNAPEDPTGPFFVLRITGTVPTLGQWTEAMDGIPVVRLAPHEHQAATGG